MSWTKYLLPALAVAGHVMAQSGCDTEVIVIQNQGDVEQYSDCDTISGDIVIAPQTSEAIDLSGIQRIEGSLRCLNASDVTGITARDLSEIGETFQLASLTRLSSLNFPALSSVGSIEWTALPVLTELTFTSQVEKSANVDISNTGLTSLNGINLVEVDRFVITNNNDLRNMDLQLNHINERLDISGNDPGLRVRLPNLEWAFNMTFRECAAVELPSLQSVNGSMGFFLCSFESFEAPNMTETGPNGSLVFANNTRLTDISLPSLTQIGGTYQIANNTELEVIDGFDQLSRVEGAIDFSGSFTNVSLPSLEYLKGAFNMQTSETLDCGPFQELKDQNVIKGDYDCVARVENPGTVSSNPNPTSGSSATPTSAARQLPVDVSSTLGVAAVVAGFLHLAF